MTAESSRADPVCRTSTDAPGDPKKPLWSIALKMLFATGRHRFSRRSTARLATLDGGLRGFPSGRLLAWRPLRRHRLRVAFPFCALLLAACASTPPTTFDLDPSIHFAHMRRSHGQLVVFEPTASLPLGSQRVVVRTHPGTIAYLHDAQWAADLPRLVQDRLIGGFETAHILRAVGRPGLLADRGLNTDIRHFEVDVTRGQAIVEIYARLVAGDGRVVAAKLFSATAPTAGDRPAAITAALSQAFAKVLHDIVIWAAPRV